VESQKIHRLRWIYCGRESTVETIQVVLDAKLLKAADVAAKRQKVNRSALIREALQEYLKRLHIRELEERERRGYEAQPQRLEEYAPWEAEAVWPEE
jgi:Ribbon-helix-helix protein, copG family